MGTYITRYTQSNPKWDKADRVIEHQDGTATVEAWGQVFENYQYKRSLSDRFEPSVNYVLVQHESGNWLKIWWHITNK